MFKIPKSIKPIFAGSLIWLTVFFFVYFGSLAIELFQVAELKSLDTYFNWSGEKKPSGDIVIVALDNKSMDDIGQWPWPRSVYAKVIDNLKASGAKVICLDIDFSSNGAIPGNDKLFAASAKRAGNVVGVSTLTTETRSSGKKGDIKWDENKLNMPIDMLNTAFLKTGVTGFELDTDSFVRNCQLAYDHNGECLYTFAVAALSVYRNIPEKDILEEVKKKNSNYKDTLRDKILVNFSGPQGTFSTYSFSSVLKNELSPEVFKGKLVLVGSTHPVLHDVFSCPYRSSKNNSAELPGVEIHANVINTLLTSNYVVRAGWKFNVFLLALLIAITTFFSLKLKPIRAIAATMGLFVFYSIGAILIFSRFNYVVNLATPLIGVILSFGAGSAYKAVTEGRKKDEVKKMFQRYVSRDVVEEIMKNPEGLKLGGKRQHMTILFSDIRNFTPMSEGLQPEEVVELLNEYFTEMNNILFKYRGTLDKFIGDAVMALFGAPYPLPNSEELAVRTAIEMQEKMKEFRAKLKAEGKNELSIGIGINAGEVIVGNIGSGQQMNYTVIGDVANTA
ncbi:MAG: adenylate/guanylate cyclase domain-containing protein, partial [Candidatus Firestonebacteria bacterium]